MHDHVSHGTNLLTTSKPLRGLLSSASFSRHRVINTANRRFVSSTYVRVSCRTTRRR